MHGSQNRAEDPEQDHNYLVRDLHLLACRDQLLVHITEFTGLGGPIMVVHTSLRMKYKD